MAIMLDATQQQKVQYCIPLWLRDEQVRANTAAVKARIQPYEGRREEPVAVVCFGPSLKETWEQVRAFKYVISCSGAHRWLIDRGIVPNWHVAVDPLPGHTVTLIGQPHPDVEYLISSTCHPDVMAHLANYNLRLWHVFDADANGLRLLPPGEWAITGGCDVGLRAMTIAGFLGFRDLHVFGMDHSAGTAESPEPFRHAAAHPASGDPKKFAVCEVDGVGYLTTPGMLAAAQGVAHELNQMPAVKATFYGEGLCQALMRHYVPKAVEDVRDFTNIVAFHKPELISSEYASLNARLHQDNLAYGVGGGKHAETVLKIVAATKATSVLDYGCGKGYLAKALPFPIWEYDPAVPGRTESPRPADVVVCTDVLEHVEPDRLQHVLWDLHRVMGQVGYFVIHTGPAQKTLADGRNTHLIQQDKSWWKKRLEQYFVIGRIVEAGPELKFVVGPKRKAAGVSARSSPRPVPTPQATTPNAPQPLLLEPVCL